MHTDIQTYRHIDRDRETQRDTLRETSIERYRENIYYVEPHDLSSNQIHYFTKCPANQLVDLICS